MIVYLIISFLACLVGAICGIGGGVMVRPALDLLRWTSVATISFFTSCMVLAMTCWSVGRSIIAKDKIMLDPGIGFAKDYEQNLEVMRHMYQLKELGYPVLLGASRKSVIGLTLDLPSEERLEGTLVTTVAAVQQGCSFVRVHDVKENYRAIQMAQAIYRRG